MALNRDEKDFLTQIGAGIVQASNNHLARIKQENEKHLADMKKISGHDELIDGLKLLDQRLRRIERRTIFDGLVNIFRRKDA